MHTIPAGLTRRAAEPPGKVLLVSADIGEGHNSAGRAVEEAIGSRWPRCQVRWLDALDAVGPRFAWLARAFYVSQVKYAPPMYDFFFTAMWRHRWYLEATRRRLGAVFGRAMAPALAWEPDLVISTYPLASAGLNWLRRRGRLAARAVAWVPAFCPHPSWLYPELDLTYVMHDVAADLAKATEPGIAVKVGAPPVRAGFAPGSQGEARAERGLPADGFLVALCPGSLAFGPVERAVRAVLAAGRGVHVIAVCGRNERLAARLAAATNAASRLHVVGWTDDMPGWMRAADIVVTNGGGATALEAITSGRPVVMFAPIAGHGRANAALMTSVGLTVPASSPAELTAVVIHLAADARARERQAGRALAWASAHRLGDDIANLADLALARSA